MTENNVLLCPKTTDERNKKRLLFVCTGNTCRSPMAAALFNHMYPDSPFRGESAGIAANGDGISENACTVLSERGVVSAPDNDYMSHVSRCVDETILSSADAIIGITSTHALNLIFRYPEFVSKIFVMPKDISDPYGGDVMLYRKTLSDIEDALREFSGFTDPEGCGSDD